MHVASISKAGGWAGRHGVMRELHPVSDPAADEWERVRGALREIVEAIGPKEAADRLAISAASLHHGLLESSRHHMQARHMFELLRFPEAPEPARRIIADAMGFGLPAKAGPVNEAPPWLETTAYQSVAEVQVKRPPRRSPGGGK